MKQLIFCTLVLLAACGKDEPQAPTPAQSAQLNEAEDMLNGMDHNEEGPEANASGPSNQSD